MPLKSQLLRRAMGAFSPSGGLRRGTIKTISTIFWVTGYKQNKTHNFLGGGVQTEKNSTFFWLVEYEQNITQLFSGWWGTNRTKLNYFLGGGVWTEQNSNIFWVAGYEQNKTQLFSVLRGTNKTVWTTHPITYTEIYIYR